MSIMEVLWDVVGLFHNCANALFYPFPLFMTFMDSLKCSYLFLQKAKKLLDKHCKVDVANEWQAVDEPPRHRFL